MMKLKPRCVFGGRDPAFTIHGYFTPCCWVDNPHGRKELEFFGLYHPDFHIDNLKTPEDIKNVFRSPEWQEFYEMLVQNPEMAPRICKKSCAVIDGELIKVTEKFDDKGKNVGVTNMRLLDVINV